MSKTGVSPAVEAAREKSSQDGIVTLSTGIKARLKPVAASLIDEVTSRIQDPQIPIWHNPDKDRDQPNPDDQGYLQAKAEATRKRGYAAIDAMVLFGVDLVDGLPEDESWLEKLRFLEKHSLIDLSGYNLQDPFEREFLYKRFVALGSEDLNRMAQMMGIPEAAVKRAAESFPGPETGLSDRGVPSP